MKAKITGVSYHLPLKIVASTEVESMLQVRNPNVRITGGIIEAATGITSRRYAAEDEYNSDMAFSAAQKLMKKASIDPSEIDLLIFAAAGQDLIEPATGHIVQEKLGTSCPVFDLKNACNSFINALEVAESLIVSERFRKILIAVGETPSKAVKWDLMDRADLKQSFAGYTLGDAGAAALIERGDDTSHILTYAGMADSSKWSTGTLPGGGSRHPRGDEFTYFRGDGAALKEAFEKIGPAFLNDFLQKHGVEKEAIDRIFIHQVSIPYLESFTNALAIDPAKVMRTVDTHGNTAAATLPLGLSKAEEQNTLHKGDLVLLVGLAGGISLELMLLRW